MPPEPSREDFSVEPRVDEWIAEPLTLKAIAWRVFDMIFYVFGAILVVSGTLERGATG
jgi:hypothetical protein